MRWISGQVLLFVVAPVLAQQAERTESEEPVAETVEQTPAVLAPVFIEPRQAAGDGPSRGRDPAPSPSTDPWLLLLSRTAPQLTPSSSRERPRVQPAAAVDAEAAPVPAPPTIDPRDPCASLPVCALPPAAGEAGEQPPAPASQPTVDGVPVVPFTSFEALQVPGYDVPYMGPYQRPENRRLVPTKLRDMPHAQHVTPFGPGPVGSGTTLHRPRD
jgi:hypothetical protein